MYRIANARWGSLLLGIFGARFAVVVYMIFILSVFILTVGIVIDFGMHNLYAQDIPVFKVLDISGPIKAIALSPNGQLLAVASSNRGFVRLIETAGWGVTGFCEYDCERESITSLVFSPDGKLLIPYPH